MTKKVIFFVHLVDFCSLHMKFFFVFVCVCVCHSHDLLVDMFSQSLGIALSLLEGD